MDRVWGSTSIKHFLVLNEGMLIYCIFSMVQFHQGSGMPGSVNLSEAIFTWLSCHMVHTGRLHKALFYWNSLCLPLNRPVLGTSQEMCIRLASCSIGAAFSCRHVRWPLGRVVFLRDPCLTFSPFCVLSDSCWTTKSQPLKRAASMTWFQWNACKYDILFNIFIKVDVESSSGGEQGGRELGCQRGRPKEGLL